MLKKFTIALIVTANLSASGCISHPALGAEQRPSSWATLINASDNLYQVSDDLYRSEQPLSANQSQLKQLNIQNIISLRSHNQTAKQLGDAGFNIIHLPINTWAIDRQDVVNTLKAIKQIQAKKQKVLIHCYHGSDRTGTMVAMYRIFLEQWSVEEAKKEMKQGGYGFHPIWINIDALFSPENIKWIGQQLNPS